MHYNGSTSYFLAHGFEIINFKAKYSEIRATQLRLRKIWEDFFGDNVKKTELDEYVYDSSVYCGVTAVADILDIPKHWMKTNVIV